MYNKKDYDRFEFIKRKLFIITNLESGRMHNKVSKYEDRTTTVISAVTGVYMLIGLFTFHFLADITGLGPIGVFIALAVLDAITSYFILLHIQFHINDRMRERTLSEDGNIKFDLSKVWRISPGGIQDNVKINDGNTVGIRYTTNAVILRGMMNGVIDCESTADKEHYSALQKLVDMVMREGYELDTFNVPYNTDNDPIWESESEKIYRTSESLGNDYTVLMTTLHNHIYDYTVLNSRITVTYYIFKSQPGCLTQPEVLATEIQKLTQVCRMKFQGINTREFKTLLEGYYGINISVEDITNYMTVTSTDLGECKIISYRDEKNNLIKKNNIFEYTLPTVFTTFDIEYNQNIDTNEIKEDIPTEVEDKSTIFDRDII